MAAVLAKVGELLWLANRMTTIYLPMSEVWGVKIILPLTTVTKRSNKVYDQIIFMMKIFEVEYTSLHADLLLMTMC